MTESSSLRPTLSGCRARCARLWSALDSDVELVLVGDPSALTHLVGYYPSQYVFRAVGASAVLAMTREETCLFVDGLTESDAREAHAGEISASPWYDGVHSAGVRRPLPLRAAREWLERRGPRVIAYDEAGTPAGLLRNLPIDVTLHAIDELLLALRRTKDSDEIELMRRAIDAGTAGHKAALSGVRPGMSELDVFELVHRAATEHVGEPIHLYGDFVSGERTEQIGGPPSQRVIRAGDLVLLDFSVVVHGYRGDFANTFVCAAAPSAEERARYEACLEALRVGEALLRPGVACREIHASVAGSFSRHAWQEFFVTHAGHGLGLGHPETPFIVKNSSDVLERGQIVTLEPGQYVKGLGGFRYERNYLITETGHELLSKHALTLEQG